MTITSESLKLGSVFEASNAFGIRKRYFLKRFLGGGATSVVFLADEIRADNTSASVARADIALKILKPETEAEWRGAFEDEIQVLRGLWEAETVRGFSWHAVPEIYDNSSAGASPCFLALEYVTHPGVDALAMPAFEIGQRIEALEELGLKLAADLRTLQEDAERVWGKDSKASLLSATWEQVGSLPDALLLARGQLEERSLAERGLSEHEVALIGAQMCRLLQLLHDLGRGYQDFQLHNIRWDRQRQRIKVLDWNVVTPARSIDVSLGVGLDLVARDLVHLADYLFWMRSWKRVSEGGASPAELVEHGGQPWRDYTSLALRLVIERALSLDPVARFAQAYDFAEVDQPLPAVADLKSLGAALEWAAAWQSADANVFKIIAEATNYQAKGRQVEALALAELALQRAEGLPTQQQRDGVKEDAREIRKQASAQIKRPAVEQGLRALDSLDVSRAIVAFAQAVAEHPADLEAWRYLSLSQSFTAAEPAQMRQLHQDKTLDELIRLIAGPAWSSAAGLLDQTERSAAIKLRDLRQDAHLERLFQSVARQDGYLKELLRTNRRDEASAAAGEVQSILDEAEAYAAQHRDHPYLAQILVHWPERAGWRQEAEDVLQDFEHDPAMGDQERQQEALACLEQGDPAGTLAELQAVSAESRTTRDLRAWAAAYLGMQRNLTSMATATEQQPPVDVAPRADVTPMETLIDGEMLEYARLLSSAPEPIKQAVSHDVMNAFDAAIAAKRLGLALRLDGLNRWLLGGKAEDRSNELAALAKELEDEKAAQIERVRARVLELEASGTPDDLAAAIQLIDGLLTSFIDDSTEATDLREKRERLSRRLKRAKAFDHEAKGDACVVEFSLEALAEAEDWYEDAASSFLDAGEEDQDKRLGKKQESIKELRLRLDELSDDIKGIDQQVAHLNHLREEERLGELVNSPKFAGLVIDLATLRRRFDGLPMPRPVEQLTERSLLLARQVGWSEEEFWARIQPRSLDWARQTLCAPISSQPDAAWLAETQAALRHFEQHPDEVLPSCDLTALDQTLQPLLGESCEQFVNFADRQEFVDASRTLETIALFHAVAWRLRSLRGETPYQGPILEASTAALPGTLTGEELASWLSQREPNQAKQELGQWLKAQERHLVTRVDQYTELALQQSTHDQELQGIKAELQNVKMGLEAMTVVVAGLHRQEVLSPMKAGVSGQKVATVEGLVAEGSPGNADVLADAAGREPAVEESLLTGVQEDIPISVIADATSPVEPAPAGAGDETPGLMPNGTQPGHPPLGPKLPEEKRPGWLDRLRVVGWQRITVAGSLAVVAIVVGLLALNWPSVEPVFTAWLSTATPTKTAVPATLTATAQPEEQPTSKPEVAVLAVNAASNLDSISIASSVEEPQPWMLSDLRDQNGNPLPLGAEIQFSIDDPVGGSLSPSVAMVTAEGMVSTQFTAGEKPGEYRLTALFDGVEIKTIPVTIAVPPDLVINVTSDRAAVQPSENLTYTVSLSHTQVGDVEGVSVACSLPSGANFVSASKAGVSNDENVVWQGITVAANDGWLSSFEIVAPSEMTDGPIAVECRALDQWQVLRASSSSPAVSVAPMWTIGVEISPTTRIVGDNVPVVITATVKTPSGALPVGNNVNFEVVPGDAGGLIAAQVPLGEDGRAIARLVISPTVDISTTVSIVAALNDQTAEATLNLIALYGIASVQTRLGIYRDEDRSDGSQIGGFLNGNRFQVLGRNAGATALFVQGEAQTMDRTGKELMQGWIGTNPLYVRLESSIPVAEFPIWRQ